jgi:hypothetical protein
VGELEVENMIIVKIAGGLGNQMFQYAAGLSLALRNKTNLKLDLSFFADRTLESYKYRDFDFDLQIFGSIWPIASQIEINQFLRQRRWISMSERVANKICKMININESHHASLKSLLVKITKKFCSRVIYVEPNPSFQPSVLELRDWTYLEGFLQDERYFASIESIIREKFCLLPDETKLPPVTLKLANEIKSVESICLHVRRGDFITSPESVRLVGFCSLDYYLKALQELKSRGVSGRVFVFSDDVKWCRENFTSHEFTVVGDEHSGPRASLHLWLMSLCKNFVICNSTYSWWAAWLSENPNKIVIRPSRWFKLPEWRNLDICPPSWIKVSNEQ